MQNFKSALGEHEPLLLSAGAQYFKDQLLARKRKLFFKAFLLSELDKVIAAHLLKCGEAEGVLLSYLKLAFPFFFELGKF